MHSCEILLEWSPILFAPLFPSGPPPCIAVMNQNLTIFITEPIIFLLPCSHSSLLVQREYLHLTTVYSTRMFFLQANFTSTIVVLLSYTQAPFLWDIQWPGRSHRIYFERLHPRSFYSQESGSKRIMQKNPLHELYCSLKAHFAGCSTRILYAEDTQATPAHIIGK